MTDWTDVSSFIVMEVLKTLKDLKVNRRITLTFIKGPNHLSSIFCRDLNLLVTFKDILCDFRMLNVVGFNDNKLTRGLVLMALLTLLSPLTLRVNFCMSCLVVEVCTTGAL